jgi:RimJ/RimL family protein N-acetyltransferase
MEPRTYLHLQLRLEGKEVFKECFLRQVEVVPDEEVPFMLIAQMANQELVVYYDEALSSKLQKELAASISDVQFPNVDSLVDILKKHNFQCEAGHYKTYVFPSTPGNDKEVLCLSKQDSRVKAFGFEGFAQHVYAIERNGKLVSACVSTRENDRCGEAWVYTDPDFRNQGFAQQVVRTWARSLMEAGKVPFYSHKIENAASANLAHRLGLQPVFEEIAIAHADESETTHLN